jgi:hypothetical protein
MDNTSSELAGILQICVGLGLLIGFFILYIWSLKWLYVDGERRGGIGCLMVILIAFFAWPWGLLIWYFARPKIK